MIKIEKCPRCGSDQIFQDEVDIGVGVEYGHACCDDCGWVSQVTESVGE